jgi:hypothetical protein
MSDALSSAELHGCPVELLPARTVLSLFPQNIGGGLLGGLSGSGNGSGGSAGKSSGGSSGELLQTLMSGGGLFGGKGVSGPNGTANPGADGATNG